MKHRLIALPLARSVGDVLIVSSESRFFGGSIYYSNLKSAAPSVSKTMDPMYIRRWRQKNWARAICISHRANDKKKGIYDEANFITYDFVEKLWLLQKERCLYCDKKMQTKYRNKRDGCTIDRINNKIGHTMGNCVLACFAPRARNCL